MKHCVKCKNKNTLFCEPCDNGSYWEETKNSFHLVMSAAMFGCGMGGVMAAVYSIFV